MTGAGRFALIDRSVEVELSDFGREVKIGLESRPKRLACRFFYDREGSVLFDAISRLPEYYLTRTELTILQGHAAELADRLPGALDLVELGSGSAAKTRVLIRAFLRGRLGLRYVPVDISRDFLEQTCRSLLEEFATLDVVAIAGEYEEGVRHLSLDEGGRQKLILWLGSNVGNLDRPEAAAFLGRLRAAMSSRDHLLVGIDLRKDRAVLEKAYDDSRGVTAAFNRNLLARINRELGGAFDLEEFEHRAVYDENEGRVEMYLVSTKSQRVRIDALDLDIDFAAREAIHTENSYKYSLDEIQSLAVAAGFRVEQQWLDVDRRFSVNLLVGAA